MYEDDFFFLTHKSSYVRMTLLFKKKKNGWVNDDFICKVVLHPDDLILFEKKKLTNPYLTNSLQTLK